MQVLPLQILHHGDDRAVLLVSAENDGIDELHSRHATGAQQPSFPAMSSKLSLPQFPNADWLEASRTV